jgi:hypothetical protein
MSDNKPPKKRRRLTWQDLPDFCDASSTVASATFAARRLDEIQALWQHNGQHKQNQNPEDSLKSGGGKTSSRHLRRRATSHLNRKRHRYPNGSLPTTTTTTKNANSDALGENGAANTKLPSRFQRRKKKTELHKGHDAWMTAQINNTQEEATATIDSTHNLRATNNTPHWMTTHVWHAKRFHMETLWGWRVPVVHSNRGAGAALRLYRQGKCLLQDLTWRMQPICLVFDPDCLEKVQQQLQRILAQLALSSSVNNSEILRYQTVVAHEMDSFPQKAIGPVRVLLSSAECFHFNSSMLKNRPCYYFWCHPCIQSTILANLKSLAETVDGCKIPVMGVNGGLACIRLRGESASNCLLTGLKALSYEANDCALLNEWISSSAPGGVSPRLQQASKSVCNTHVLVVMECRANEDGIAYDVFWEPQAGKDLFQALIISGGGCPIGLVEETHLMLELPQPVTVFPRDYPDTIEGLMYWNAASAGWNIFRSCTEGGTGRITKERTKLERVDWTSLVDKGSPSVVVVRGAFGKPFWNALSSTCKESDLVASNSGRRNRRKSRAMHDGVLAPRLSKEAASKRAQECRTLRNSLTLPAIITCHLFITKKGKAPPGMELFAVDTEDALLLGYTSFGSFSPSRGGFHGLAICGAARWLEAVASAVQKGTIVLARQHGSDSRECQLPVQVGSTPGCQGRLALLR